jgi:putative Mg2+ transporter-C (MgtC) family protein
VGVGAVTTETVDMVHVLVAAGLTYAIGFERDLRRAGAGERVFALIGVGAGIVGVLAAHGAPTALTGVLTGVGFIGAGLLFRQERPEFVRGLTTAAAILAAVAIGAAAGDGQVLVAVVGTAITLLVLEGRYVRLFRLLDARRYSGRFRHERPPESAGRRYRNGAGDSPEHAGEQVPVSGLPSGPAKPRARVWNLWARARSWRRSTSIR